MSDRSRLTIGDVTFQWTYEVPSFLTFVFKVEDMFIEREKPPPPEPGEAYEYDLDELEIKQAGFRTTVGAAKRVLNNNGYTREFFVKVYSSFLDGVEESVRYLGPLPSPVDTPGRSFA